MKRAFSHVLILVLLFGGMTVYATGQKEPAPQKSVHLSLILITGHDPFQSVVDNYVKANPGVTVDVQNMPTEQFKTIIKTKFAADDAPDVFPIFNDDESVSYVKNGYVADLSGMSDVVSRLKTGADSTLRTDTGVLFAFPVEMQLIFMYYNKDMFKAKGVSIPKTWDDFVAACKTFMDKGITPITIGHKDTWTTQMIPYGLTPAKVHNKDPKFQKDVLKGLKKYADNAGWVDIMSKYEYLLGQGFFNKGSLGTSFEQSLQMFANGDAAMTPNGTWAMGTINDMKPAFAVGGFPIPADKADAPAASASINGGYTVYAKSKNMDSAKKLLAYMVSPAGLSIYLKDKGPAPFKDVNISLAPAINEVIDLEKGMPLYNFDNWAIGVQEVFMKSIQEMVAGQINAIAVLKACDEATKKALNR
jgi:raffinose/stachyose/melibiose transport system substrate-binding protein